MAMAGPTLVVRSALAVILLALGATNASRSYKYLELDNGMRVLLVSDPHSSKSAASLDVGIGSWSDPEKIPGLAHFLEHMLFLGTEKYPIEGDYRRFLSKHAGIENAYTIYENTNFYFSASGGISIFEEAVDRFSQFFISPTLNAAAGQREMQAVDSEFRKRINNDYLRFRQVLMTMANPAHPYHRFTTGTIDTLNITGIHSKLVQFHKTYYSANLMTLVILGKFSLRALEDLARGYFSAVPNLNLQRPNFNKPPAFPVPAYTGIKILMEPLGVANTVYMYWPLPSLDHAQRALPIYYIAWLLGHEGAGSVLSELKSRQWATAVLAGPGLQTTSHWLMQICFTLTDAGLANLNEFVSIVFQYIHLIEKEGVQERIYKEQHRLNLLNYLYQPKSRPDVFVKTISRNMQVLTNPKDFRLPPSRSIYDPKLIRSVLSLLTPQRLLLFVASPHYKQAGSGLPNPLKIAKPSLDKVEPWYTTNYHSDKIPRDTLNMWETTPTLKELGIPAKNDFVPGKLPILPMPECSDIRPAFVFLSMAFKKVLERRQARECRRAESGSCRCSFEFPERLIGGKGYDLWWKRELNYRTPKLFMDILLGSADFTGTIKQAAASLLFRHLVLSYLNDKVYPAELAGFKVHVTTPVAGIQISLSGYSDDSAFKKLISTVLDGLTGYVVRTQNETWFSSSQRRTAESIAGFGPTAQVYKHVKGVYENRIMQKIFYDRGELAKAMMKLTPQEVRDHVSQNMKKLYITMLVYGNANQHEGRSYGAHVIREMSTKGLKTLLPRKTILHQQRLRLAPGSNIAFRMQGPNPSDINSGINVMLQIGPACNSRGTCDEEKSCQMTNVVHFILSRALAYYMRAAVFEQLRTKEQLGYIVFSYPYKSNGVASVHFLVQSSKYDPQYLLERIEAFIRAFTKTLTNRVMNRAQWSHGIRLGAAVAMSSGHSTLTRDQAYWRRLVDGNCKFNRRDSSVQALRYLIHRPREMLAFYERYFLKKSSRKLMAIQLYGKGRTVSTVAAEGQTIVTEDNVEQYKASADFYPPETD